MPQHMVRSKEKKDILISHSYLHNSLNIAGTIKESASSLSKRCKIQANVYFLKLPNQINYLITASPQFIGVVSSGLLSTTVIVWLVERQRQLEIKHFQKKP